MQMTDDEIAVRFRQAKNRKQQVKILAELNAVPVNTIVEILQRKITDKRALRYLGSYTATETPEPDKPESPVNHDKLDDSINCVAARIRELVNIRNTADEELNRIYARLSEIQNI